MYVNHPKKSPNDTTDTANRHAGVGRGAGHLLTDKPSSYHSNHYFHTLYAFSLLSTCMITDRLQNDSEENIQTIPTIGFNVEVLQYKNIKFQVWDLGGQTSIRPYWRCYYPNTGNNHTTCHDHTTTQPIDTTLYHQRSPSSSSWFIFANDSTISHSIYRLKYQDITSFIITLLTYYGPQPHDHDHHN